MAVVARKTRKGATYYVVFRWEGRQVWECSGGDRRAAERLDRKRKREVEAGTYHPDAGPAPSLTVGQYAPGWLDRRTNRTAADDRRWLSLHVLPRHWFAAVKMEDVRPRHVERLVDDLKAEGKLTEKSIANIIGVLHVMFNDAHRAEHCSQNPVNLPAGKIRRAPQKEAETYSIGEVVALIRNEQIPEGIRVLNGMCLLGGAREGEACGRRWRDLDVDTEPLWCLSVHSQYDDRPLKTDRPRVVPVHPELARLLERWARGGFELLTGRRPSPDDFIVPNVSPWARKRNHTKKTYYRALVEACKALGIRPRESLGTRSKAVHAARHTFVSMARRAGAPKDVVERITHNARGDIVDRYTHGQWAPLCEAVERISLDVDAHQHRRMGPGNGGKDGGPGRLLSDTVSRDFAPNAESGRGSIPGASTHPQHKTSGRRKSSNSQSNGLTVIRGNLRLVELLDPDAAKPGLAVIRGLDAAQRGDEPATLAALREGAEALAGRRS